MASGVQHDRATVLLAVPVGLLSWPWLGWMGVWVVACSFLVGGLMLSPDLDIPSRPTSRWGVLAILWWPYRRLLRHRSLLSHSPVLGSLGRLLYLLLLLALVLLLGQRAGLPEPGSLLDLARHLWRQHQPLVVGALLGVEASSWLHLIQDGDPLSSMPRLLRRRRRRSARRRR